MAADRLGWVPLVATMRGYRRAWWREDLVAGAVLTAMLIPAGIGYARAAGLPPETGLYATIVPLLVYAALGPSRILVLGPDSSLAPIIGAAVLPLAVGDPRRAVSLAGLLAVLVGLLLLVGSALRAGAVTALLSRPIRVGYLNGIALVVLAGQIPTLLGIQGGRISLGWPFELRGGAFEPAAAAFGVICLAVLVAARLTGRTVLGLAGVVVVSAAVVAAAGLSDELPVVGELPPGLPTPARDLTWADVRDLAGPAAGVALIAFTDTAVLSRSFAARDGRSVDGSAEMRGIGAANLATGLLGGFPVCASSSRTPVAEQAGARTQLTGVVGAALVALFVLVAPGATGYLPSATLAAVVVVAALSLVDVPGLVRLARTHPVDGALSLVALAGVVVLGVLEGIVVAVVLSLAAFIRRASRPYRTQLGRLPGVRGYHDLSRHAEGRVVPGCVIVRFDAPLFFANGELFDDFVRKAVEDRPDARLVVVAAEPITDVDSTAIEHLLALDDWLAARGVPLVLAEAKGPVKDRLRGYAPDRFGPERFAPTTGAAVDAFTGELRGDL